jgi:TonB-linked SusC/RagA family outer membrane protein
MTDFDGGYTLKVPSENSVLEFSFVGFITKTIELDGRSEINIALVTNEESLGEVVVVGFGTQKKSDLVGSVATINPSELRAPSSNLTNALAGRVAGVIGFQRSGEPGADNANFFIRGVTSFGYNNNPLILIDGVELTTTDLARLNVDDIESFSILKDATSTAVYGARGANGVILVKTKMGSVGKAKISVRIENSISTATQDIELTDPLNYMKMANEAVRTRDPLGEILYSDSKIANTGLSGSDPLLYPTNDWREIMFKDYTMNQRANLNVSGGGGVARYFVSGSFTNDTGIMKKNGTNNFNNNISLKSSTLRANVDVDVTKSTKLIIRLSGNFDDYTGPIRGGEDMYNLVMHSNPVLFPAFYPKTEQYKYVDHIMYGNYDRGNGAAYINPYAEMTKGYKDYSRSLMLAQFELSQDLSFLAKGLSFRTMVNTKRNAYFDISRFYNPYFYQTTGYDPVSETNIRELINEDSATNYLGYDEGAKEINSSFYLESMLNYNRTFNEKHAISGLLVYIMQQRLTGNAGDLQLSLPFRNMGISGRATYAYANRYFAEFAFGYNGSERFAQDERFGFFPSIGLAWSVSNEKFFEPIKSVITNLRFRATYGIIGNDAIGAPEDRFFYLSNVNLNDGGRGAGFGRGDGASYYLNGVSISRYSNPKITWEKATKKNFGIELGLYKDLNISADFYTEDRTNILMDRSAIPLTMGLAAATRANVGEASGKGVDLTLDYKTSFSNGKWLTALGNLTYATNEFKVFEEPKYDEPYRSRIGNPINQVYGYIAERLFIDDEEAENSPRQNFGEYGGGDIKYTDVNRDGQITPADQVPLGHPTVPEITYGFGFSAGNKSFDVSLFFQGLANESFWIDVNQTSPFQGETQVLKAYADSYWSEDNQDVNALWPRLSPVTNQNNAQTSTRFMRDGAFLRLKQVEIGYTASEKFLEKIYASSLRVYINASNLLTFSKFKLWDVEMGGQGLGYPIQKALNLGLHLSFN